MGSDKIPVTVNNTSSSSEPTTDAQDSSIFGDISNISPVQPFKDAAPLQGFTGIISPPNVFTAPHINAHSSFLNRQQQLHTSLTGFSLDSGNLVKPYTTPDDPERMISQLNIAVESSDQKGSKASIQLQTVNTLAAVEKLLFSPVDREFIDVRSREHDDDAPTTSETKMSKKDCTMANCRTNETSMMLFKQTDGSSQGGFVTGDSQMKDGNYQFVSTSDVWSDEKCGDSLNEVNEVFSGGVLRRCLQFGEHQHKPIKESLAYTPGRQICISDLSTKFSPQAPCNRLVAGQSEFASTKCFSSCTSNVVSKPRGIGLHLNSIVASPPRGLVSAKKLSKGMVKLEGKSLILSGTIHARAKSSNNVEQTSSIAESDMYVSEPVEMVNPYILLSSNSADALESPVPLSSVCEELAESTEVLNEGGSITGRKQASSSANPDGCKRCSCKKSKCLKLYCDCFAAGLYCVESCSCKGCYNRQEFKDKVIEARQQIESRNPLAFAPRIMQHVTNSPTNSGESVESVAPPPSLRHKRGCNCRKSMCLKKYCECYQSNVGCSDGCRCDGCKNVYGKKLDYSFSRHIVNKRTFDDISEETPYQKHKLLIASRSHVPLEKGDDSPVAVPITPVSSCSHSRKKEMKSLLPGRRYVLSPDPNLRTPRSGIHQSSSGSSVVQNSSRNRAEAIQLVPSTHGGLVNLCNFTQLTNPLQMTALSPSSIARDMQKSPPLSPYREIARSKTPDYLHAAGWPGEDTMDNDTPAILRYSPDPMKPVKISSPNKKRISPPHNHLNDLRPISSGQLKSSRRYVFRSVPKFPPLSPCLNSKDPIDPPA